MAKRSNRIDWRPQLPRIQEMMKTMTDAQIGKMYCVGYKKINDVRKYHGLLRDGEALYASQSPKRKIPPMKWDFGWMNLSC